MTFHSQIDKNEIENYKYLLENVYLDCTSSHSFLKLNLFLAKCLYVLFYELHDCATVRCKPTF